MNKNYLLSHTNFIEKIYCPEIKVISFDIFDTCIFRPFLFPKDLFEYIETDVKKIVNSPMWNYVENRMLAEQIAINKHKTPTIYDIYEVLQQTCNINKDDALLMINIEITAELELCRQNTKIFSIYTLAQKLKKKIIFISDMYLPHITISEILIRNGFDEFDELFVSCECNATKKSGKLFDYVTNKLKISAKSIIHIGDNKESDINTATQKNIYAFYTPKPRDLFFGRTTINKLLYGDIAKLDISKKAILGIVANKFSQISKQNEPPQGLFEKNKYFFGYYALGPFVLGLTQWIMKLAIQKNKNHIFFCARDGYLLHEAVKILTKNLNYNIEYSYLPISRCALMPFGISKPGGFDYLKLIAKESSLSTYDFFSAIFGNKTYFEEFLQLIPEEFHSKKIKQSIDNILLVVNDNYAAFNQLFIEDSINIKKYYRNTIKSPQKALFFDIGRRGMLQACLSTILKNNLDFTYLFSSKHFDRNIKRKNADVYLGDESISIVKKSYQNIIYEALLSSTEGMFIGVNPDMTEAFESTENNCISNKKILEIQQGSLDFIKDFSSTFKENISNFDYNNYFTTFLLEYFWRSECDSDILDGICFTNSLSFSNCRQLWSSYMEEKIQFHPSNMPRVLLYVPSMFSIKGGSERMAQHLTNYFDKKKYIVKLCSKGNDLNTLDPVYILPKSTILSAQCNEINILEEELVKFKPDVVLTLSTGRYVRDIAKICRKYYIPLIISERYEPSAALNEFWSSFTTSDYIKTYNSSYCVTVQMNSYIDALPKQIQAPIVTLYNPVKQQNEIPPYHKRKKIILHIGRLRTDHKRQDVLFQAFELISKTYDDWELHFYGNTSYDNNSEFQNYVSASSIKNKVYFLGEVENLEPVFCNASIFAFPSLIEGFPNALAEALSYGLPSIGFEECPGVNELILNGFNGILVKEDGNVHSFAVALENLIADYEMRVAMSNNAILSIKKYEPQKIFRNVSEIIEVAAAVHRNSFRKYMFNDKKTSKNNLTANEKKILKLYRQPKNFLIDMIKNIYNRHISK